MGLIGNIKSRISLEKKEETRNLLRHFAYYLWKLSSAFKEKIGSKKIKRVLVINLGVIGDSIVATPMIRALSEKYGKVDIIMKSGMEQVLLGNPNIRKIIIYTKAARALKEIKGKYHLAIIFSPPTLEMKILCMRAGIRYTVGLSHSYSFSDFFLSSRCKENKGQHLVQKALDMARLVDADNKNPKTEFYFSRIDEKNVKKMIKTNSIKKYAVVHAGNRSNLKDSLWTNEGFAETADYLAKKYKLAVIFTGTSPEKQRTLKIISLTKSKNIFNFCEKTNIKQLGVLVKNAKIVVCLNTGVSHLASAFEVPTIVINEPFPDLWHPWLPENKRCMLFNPEPRKVKMSIDWLLKGKR
jgi:ADP-heptose:LPS heptosyltransferase